MRISGLLSEAFADKPYLAFAAVALESASLRQCGKVNRKPGQRNPSSPMIPNLRRIAFQLLIAQGQKLTYAIDSAAFPEEDYSLSGEKLTVSRFDFFAAPITLSA